MIDTFGRRLFLKTFHGDDVHEWGVLALPSQHHTRALRAYRDGDLVLLAQSGASLGDAVRAERGGRFFAVCTLRTDAGGETRELASPQALERWARQIAEHGWRWCVMIDRYWRLRSPVHFRDIDPRAISRRAAGLRGKLGPLDLSAAVASRVHAWLGSAETEVIEVLRSG